MLVTFNADPPENATINALPVRGSRKSLTPAFTSADLVADRLVMLNSFDVDIVLSKFGLSTQRPRVQQGMGELWIEAKPAVQTICRMHATRQRFAHLITLRESKLDRAVSDAFAVDLGP